MLNRPKVLVFAGVDSGGGAGITADCITIYDNQAFALPCITALTAQSLKRIIKVDPVSEDTFNESLQIALLDWDNISAVKVGLVTDASHLERMLSVFEKELKDVPVVWDPVLTGTAGDLKSADIKKNLKKILKVTTVFTPNLPEAMTLMDWTEQDVKEKGVKALAEEFLKLGAKAVIVKGGHNLLNQDAADTYVEANKAFVLSYPRVDGEGAHGGGCALSSATAALIANGNSIFDAVVKAKAYVYQGIVEPAFDSNHYRPPIGHHQNLKIKLPEIHKL